MIPSRHNPMALPNVANSRGKRAREGLNFFAEWIRITYRTTITTPGLVSRNPNPTPISQNRNSNLRLLTRLLWIAKIQSFHNGTKYRKVGGGWLSTRFCPPTDQLHRSFVFFAEVNPTPLTKQINLRFLEFP